MERNCHKLNLSNPMFKFKLSKIYTIRFTPSDLHHQIYTIRFTPSDLRHQIYTIRFTPSDCKSFSLWKELSSFLNKPYFSLSLSFTNR